MDRWFSLEKIPGLVAMAPTWQEAWGSQFTAFQRLCLQEAPSFATTFTCPKNCGCRHSVIHRHDQTGAVAICRCNPPSCPDIVLTLADITPLQIDTPKLGRALCTALALAPKPATMAQPHTAQFGSWSPEAIPAILTIQSDHPTFRRVVAELAAELRQPFALFAPTATYLDAPSKAHLQDFGAAFFPLETTVELTPDGTLRPLRQSAELFACLTPGNNAAPAAEQ